MNSATEFKKDDEIFDSTVLEQFKQKKKTLSDEKSYKNKDLLFNAIIDLVTNKSQQSSVAILGASGIKRCVDAYILKLNHNRDIQKCAKRLFQQSKQKGNNELENRAMEVIEAFKSTTKELLTGPINEAEYTCWFLYPVLLQATLDCNVEIRLGDSCLGDNMSETESEADMTFYSKRLRIPICLVEVSGAPDEVDKQYYLNDRNKLANNLKDILQKIEGKMLTPNFAALKKIRLFGIQIYSNVLYLYSLSKQTEEFYVFVLEARLPIPSNGALLPYQVPSFMGRLWNIGMLLNSSHKRIDIFFEESAERDIDSSSFSSTNCEVIRKKSRVE